VSESLREQVLAHPGLEVTGEAVPMVFDDEGQLEG
jgi:hypothetical protein